MFGSRPGEQHPFDEPANPLSDEQTMAQVVDPAKEIARAVPLPDVTGGFGFGSCNDQGDPPFQGVVEMTFKLPDGITADDYLRQVSEVMRRLGWNEGARRQAGFRGTDESERCHRNSRSSSVPTR